MKKPLDMSFDCFGDRTILRARFSNGDGTCRTHVLNLSELLKQTDNSVLKELIATLQNENRPSH